MAKEYPAKESTCQEILAKVAEVNLSNVEPFVSDFTRDNIVLREGCLMADDRLIIC